MDINRFIASVPAGSVVEFPAGACYAQTASIVIDDRASLTIDGRGATFQKTSPSVPGETGASAVPNWRLAGGSQITLQNMVIKGVYRGSPNLPNQFDSGVLIWGTQGVTLRNLSVASVDGDFVTVDPDPRSGAPLAAATPARDIVVDRLRGRGAARQGVAFTSTIGATVTRSVIDGAQNGVDLEPDAPGEPVRDVRIEGNRFGALTYTAVAAIPGESPAVGNVTIVANRMTLPPDSCYAAITVGGDSTAPSPVLKAGYSIRANTLLTRADGLLLNGVTSGAVAANTITNIGTQGRCTPLLPAVPVRAVNSAGVTVLENSELGFG